MLDLGVGADRRASPAQARWMQQALPDLAATRAQQSADQAADNLSVSNAVTSLRAIGAADWNVLVARTSPLVQLMRLHEPGPVRGRAGCAWAC